MQDRIEKISYNIIFTLFPKQNNLSSNELYPDIPKPYYLIKLENLSTPERVELLRSSRQGWGISTPRCASLARGYSYTNPSDSFPPLRTGEGQGVRKIQEKQSAGRLSETEVKDKSKVKIQTLIR